ncbi:hypothetical protein EYF80_022748 [Liparis tanakae]|uniref:Uncharacterized protein n=1 Tax=Liparis tanakae TaxID=230148 RepID=A0A4Z2HNY4_9TELE|nr:hypothetical protein EYF80_022748 [Liparis tanakae]
MLFKVNVESHIAGYDFNFLNDEYLNVPRARLRTLEAELLRKRISSRSEAICVVGPEQIFRVRQRSSL